MTSSRIFGVTQSGGASLVQICTVAGQNLVEYPVQGANLIDAEIPYTISAEDFVAWHIVSDNNQKGSIDSHGTITDAAVISQNVGETVPSTNPLKYVAHFKRPVVGLEMRVWQITDNNSAEHVKVTGYYDDQVVTAFTATETNVAVDGSGFYINSPSGSTGEVTFNFDIVDRIEIEYYADAPAAATVNGVHVSFLDGCIMDCDVESICSDPSTTLIQYPISSANLDGVTKPLTVGDGSATHTLTQPTTGVATTLTEHVGNSDRFTVTQPIGTLSSATDPSVIEINFDTPVTDLVYELFQIKRLPAPPDPIEAQDHIKVTAYLDDVEIPIVNETAINGAILDADRYWTSNFSNSGTVTTEWTQPVNKLVVEYYVDNGAGGVPTIEMFVHQKIVSGCVYDQPIVTSPSIEPTYQATISTVTATSLGESDKGSFELLNNPNNTGFLLETAAGVTVARRVSDPDLTANNGKEIMLSEVESNSITIPYLPDAGTGTGLFNSQDFMVGFTNNRDEFTTGNWLAIGNNATDLPSNAWQLNYPSMQLLGGASASDFLFLTDGDGTSSGDSNTTLVDDVRAGDTITLTIDPILGTLQYDLANYDDLSTIVETASIPIPTGVGPYYPFIVYLSGAGQLGNIYLGKGDGSNTSVTYTFTWDTTLGLYVGTDGEQYADATAILAVYPTAVII